MKAIRIHILGATGAGTSSLGEALARRLEVPHFDSDHFFWEKTDPPFTSKRPTEERRALLEGRLKEAPAWVLSGSVAGWANWLKPVFSHVIFVPPATEERLKHEAWLRSVPCPVLRLDSTAPIPELTDSALRFFAYRYPEVHVEELKGLAAASAVDPFFESLGRSTRAQPSDHFFVAKCGTEVLGCVRFCVEHETPMLRGMLIAERARRQGVGQALLKAFDAHLKRHRIAGVYCVPHDHLTSFYGGIGFRRVAESSGPSFLQERVAHYRENGMPDVILMRRG